MIVSCQVQQNDWLEKSSSGKQTWFVLVTDLIQ